MILCHKCSGVLASDAAEDISGLLGCSCISGYVRGFESELSRKDALVKQIKAQNIWLALYQQQGRAQRELDSVKNTINRLESLPEAE